MTTREKRREAWDAGIAAATRHAVDGARLASPYRSGTVHHGYFKRAANLTIKALHSIMDMRP